MYKWSGRGSVARGRKEKEVMAGMDLVDGRQTEQKVKDEVRKMR